MTSPHRLARTDFSRIPRHARRLNSALFGVLIGTDQSGSVPKFTVVVSKKVSIRAVKRNLLKRRFRAALRECVHLVPQGSLLVLSVKKEALSAPMATIREELGRVLSA